MTADPSVGSSQDHQARMGHHARFAPLVISRVGGLPVDVCHLTTDTTRELLAKTIQVTEELEKLSPDLVDACFVLVPRLDDDAPLRRKALAGKRAVHRLASLPWTDQAQEALSHRGGERFAALVRRWRDLTELRDHLHTSLDERLERDGSDALDQMQKTLHDPRFARSLAVVAPDWFRHGNPTDAAPSPRDLRTLYSYVTRTALKTSPLSGLTTVGVAGTQGVDRAFSRTSIDVALHALRQLCASKATAHLFRFRAVPVREGGPESPNGLLLHADLSVGGGKSWRLDQVMEADHARRWLDRFDADHRDDLGLTDILHGLGGDQPFERFRRLLHNGVFQPVPPWSNDEDPLTALAQRLDGLPPSADGGPIPVAEVIEAQRLGAAAARSDSDSRVESALRLRELTHPWLRDDWGTGASAGVVYEDRETDAELWNPRDNANVRTDLEQLTRRMRPFVFRTHLYDVLVNRFVAEYGRGGRCQDVLGFLMRLSVDRDNNPLVDGAHAADRACYADPGGRAWLPVGPTSAPPSAAIFFQLRAGERRDIEDGRYRLVVNQFNAGTGGLLSRFRRLLGQEFSDRLRSHVETLWDGAPVRELIVGTDTNTAQAECSGMFPALTLPGEVPTPNAITLDETQLVHNPENDTLDLVDNAGEVVGLAYLGLVPQHMMAPFVRLLTVLADPWINASADSDHSLPFEFGEYRGSDVAIVPRVEEGRLVTNRASWIVPTECLPLDPTVDDRELVLGMEEFRARHGIPEFVFLHQLGGLELMRDGGHKPMWADLRSPLSLRALCGSLRQETRHVRVAEALPEPTAHPERDATGTARATEHITLTYWSRPQELGE